METTLRYATIDDAPALGALHAVCFGGPQAYVRPWTEDDFRNFLERSNYHGSNPFIVAEKDNQIAGFIMVNFNADRPFHATIMTVDVAPAYRQEGIASLLLRAVEDHIHTHRAFALDTAIAAAVNTANTPSQKLFSAFGYASFGIKKDFYASGIDAVVVQKNIPAAPPTPPV